MLLGLDLWSMTPSSVNAQSVADPTRNESCKDQVEIVMKKPPKMSGHSSRWYLMVQG